MIRIVRWVDQGRWVGVQYLSIRRWWSRSIFLVVPELQIIIKPHPRDDAEFVKAVVSKIITDGVIIKGNVGIGTTAPLHPLHIVKAGVPQARFAYNGSIYMDIGYNRLDIVVW